MTQRSIGFAIVGLLAGLWVGSSGATAEPPWEPVLKTQLAETHSCTLAHFVFVREQPLGKQIGIEGRVRCADGREFDFTRQRAHEKFVIRLCMPTVC